MDFLENLTPRELINLGISLFSECAGIVSCSQNITDIFLITAAVFCLFAVVAVVLAIALFWTLNRIFTRAVRKANTPGGRS